MTQILGNPLDSLTHDSPIAKARSRHLQLWHPPSMALHCTPLHLTYTNRMQLVFKPRSFSSSPHVRYARCSQNIGTRPHTLLRRVGRAGVSHEALNNAYLVITLWTADRPLPDRVIVLYSAKK